MPSAYHHGDLRAAIIAAGLELARCDGATGVSMRKAAREVGVSNAAPYRHFKDHDELMSAIAAAGHRELEVQTQVLMADAGDNPLHQLRAQGIAYVRFAKAQPHLFRIMNNATWIAPGSSPEMDQALADLAQWTDDTASDATQAKAMIDRPDGAAVLACRALVYGLARMYVDGHADQLGLTGHDETELAERVIDVMGVGLIPRKGDTTAQS